MTAARPGVRCAECDGSPRVHATKLCAGCYRAVLARVRADLAERRPPASAVRAAKRPTPSTPRPKPRKINPSDVLAVEGARPTVEDRAVHLARWVHRVGESVTRADAVRVAGVDPMSGSARAVLERAEQRGWVARDEVGAVLPGDMRPPARRPGQPDATGSATTAASPSSAAASR